jgi:PAS domain S-box-containing protein
MSTPRTGSILIVDDTPSALRLMRDVLAAEGYRVLTADGGELALRSLAINQPELILLDLRMPVMDGFEVCRRLKAQPETREIPVIFISAVTDVEERVEGFALGAVDFITKPFQREELLARVKTHLDLRRLQTRLEEQIHQHTAALEKSNRAYRALSSCNRLVALATGEEQLLQEACEIVTQVCGYRMVWIGLAESDPEKSVRPVAQAGFEDGYLATVRITWADEDHGRGPTGTAIRTGHPVINPDSLNNPLIRPWREQALKRGYKSTAAVPLGSDGECLGAMTVYADQVNAFEDEEIRLLNELAANLAHGIRLLRAQLERRRGEELLHASEEKYRALIESTSDWIWEVDAHGCYVYSSPRVLDILGYRPEEVIGKSCLELMPISEALRLRPLVGQIFAAQAPIQNLQDLNLHRDGHPVMLETCGVPVFDDSGRFTGYRGIDRDISQRKRAEEELLKHREHLEELVAERTAALEATNRELEDFLYSVSHDLRTPLRAIDGFSGQFEKKYRDSIDADGRRLIKVVRSNTARMSQLLDDILAFSRSGRTELRETDVDMSRLVETLWQELEPARCGRKVDFNLGLLPCARGDPMMLRQVWLNLLGNAIKFTRSRAEARIDLSGTLADGELSYRIRDNGVGFDPAYAHKLFGVFQRLHGIEEFEGTGIGLAIVKRIVERHGGRVKAEGHAGEGASITFTLPGYRAASSSQSGATCGGSS